MAPDGVAGVEPRPAIAFDLDGTLLSKPPHVVFDDVAQVACLEPIDAAVHRARGLRRQGYRLTVVTGRRANLKDVTRLQVRVLLGEGVPFVWAPNWTQPNELLTYKTEVLARLKELGLELYVGDSWIDREAARRTGVAFVHARDFAGGDRLPVS